MIYLIVQNPNNTSINSNTNPVSLTKLNTNSVNVSTHLETSTNALSSIGFCWSKNNITPTIYDNYKLVTYNTINGSYYIDDVIDNLSDGLYYIRAFKLEPQSGQSYSQYTYYTVSTFTIDTPLPTENIITDIIPEQPSAGYIISASSTAVGYDSWKAFDKQYDKNYGGNGWRSTIAYTNGLPSTTSGSTKTTVNGGDIYGEWIEIGNDSTILNANSLYIYSKLWTSANQTARKLVHVTIVGRNDLLSSFTKIYSSQEDTTININDGIYYNYDDVQIISQELAFPLSTYKYLRLIINKVLATPTNIPSALELSYFNKMNGITINRLVTVTEISNTNNIIVSTSSTTIVNSGSNITETGICWSTTNTTPTKNDNYKTTSPKITYGSYDIQIDNLSGATYYLRSFYIDNNNIYYGTVKSYNLPQAFFINNLSTVATNSINTITVNSQTPAGSIIESGVCWSTSQSSPTKNDSFQSTSSAVINNTYSVVISNLTTTGIYYLRSFYMDSNHNIYYGTVTTTTFSIMTSTQLNGALITKDTVFPDGKKFVDSSIATDVIINEFITSQDNTSVINSISDSDQTTKLLKLQKTRKLILLAKFIQSTSSSLIIPREVLGFTPSQVKTQTIKVINPSINETVNLTTSEIVNSAIYCLTSDVAKSFIVDSIYTVTFLSAIENKINLKIKKYNDTIYNQDLDIGKTIVNNGMIITLGSGMISILSSIVSVNNNNISVTSEVINPENNNIMESGICWSKTVSEPTKTDSHQLTTDPISNGTYTIAVNNLTTGTYNLRSYYTDNKLINVRMTNIRTEINYAISNSFAPPGYFLLTNALENKKYMIGPGIDMSNIVFNTIDARYTLLSSPITTVSNIGVQSVSGLPTSNLEPVNGFDDGYWMINSPFPIKYNGTSYNTIYVGTNSFITFEEVSFSVANSFNTYIHKPKILLSSADMMATHFNTNVSGNIGSRILSLRYQGYLYSNSSKIISWEVKFYETNIPLNNIDIIFTKNDNLGDTGFYDSTNKLFDISTQPNIGTRMTISGLDSVKYDFDGIDFTDVNLKNTDFSQKPFSFKNCIFTGAKFDGTKFHSFSDFTGAKFSDKHAVLPDIIKKEYDSTGALTSHTYKGFLFGKGIDISGKDISLRDFSSYSFVMVRAKDMGINNTKLPTGYKFVNGSIVGPHMNLSYYDFSDSDLTGISLYGTDLTNAVFINTNLTNVKSGSIIYSEPPYFKRKRGSTDTFLPYDISNGYIIGPNVDLSNADLSGVDFGGKAVDGINFYKAKLSNSLCSSSIQILDKSEVTNPDFKPSNVLNLNSSYRFVSFYKAGLEPFVTNSLNSCYLVGSFMTVTNCIFINSHTYNYDFNNMTFIYDNANINGIYFNGQYVKIFGTINQNYLSTFDNNVNGLRANSINFIFPNFRYENYNLTKEEYVSSILFSGDAKDNYTFVKSKINDSGAIIGPYMYLNGDFTGYDMSKVSFTDTLSNGLIPLNTPINGIVQKECILPKYVRINSGILQGLYINLFTKNLKGVAINIDGMYIDIDSIFQDGLDFYNTNVSDYFMVNEFRATFNKFEQYKKSLSLAYNIKTSTDKSKLIRIKNYLSKKNIIVKKLDILSDFFTYDETVILKDSTLSIYHTDLTFNDFTIANSNAICFLLDYTEILTFITPSLTITCNQNNTYTVSMNNENIVYVKDDIFSTNNYKFTFGNRKVFLQKQFQSFALYNYIDTSSMNSLSFANNILAFNNSQSTINDVFTVTNGVYKFIFSEPTAFVAEFPQYFRVIYGNVHESPVSQNKNSGLKTFIPYPVQHYRGIVQIEIFGNCGFINLHDYNVGWKYGKNNIRFVYVNQPNTLTSLTSLAPLYEPIIPSDVFITSDVNSTDYEVVESSFLSGFEGWKAFNKSEPYNLWNAGWHGQLVYRYRDSDGSFNGKADGLGNTSTVANGVTYKGEWVQLRRKSAKLPVLGEFDIYVTTHDYIDSDPGLVTYNFRHPKKVTILGTNNPSDPSPTWELVYDSYASLNNLITYANDETAKTTSNIEKLQPTNSNQYYALRFIINEMSPGADYPFIAEIVYKTAVYREPVPRATVDNPVNTKLSVLSGRVFRNLNLDNTKWLSNCNLSGSVFLSSVHFGNAEISNSIITNADLTEITDISSCVLTNVTTGNILVSTIAVPHGCEIDKDGFIIGPHLNLSNIDFTGVNFYDMNLSGSNLSGCNLTNIKSGKVVYDSKTTLPDGYIISNGYIIGPNVILTNADFSNVVIPANISLSGIVSGNITYTKSQPPTFNNGYKLASGYIVGPKCILTNAKFNNKLDLSGVDLSGSTLINCTLTNMNLTNVNLAGCQLNGLISGGIMYAKGLKLDTEYIMTNGYIVGPYVNLKNADISDAILNLIDLSGVTSGKTISSNASFKKNEMYDDLYKNVDGYILGPNIDFSYLDLSNSILHGLISGGNRYMGTKLPSGYKFVGPFDNGYLIGDSVNLHGANFSNIIFDNDVSFKNVRSGNITSINTTFLNTNYSISNGYIVGPYVDLSYSSFPTTNGQTHKQYFKNKNLHAVNLSGMDLSYFDLSGCDLTYATLKNVKSGNIISDNLTRLPTGYKISNGYIVGAFVILSNIDFSLLDTDIFKNMDLSNTDLTNSNLSNLNLSGTIFTDTILTNIKSKNISGTTPSFNTSHKIFDGYIIGPSVCLDNANFLNINLSNVNFTGVRSSNVTAVNTVFPIGVKLINGHIIGPDMDISGYNLSGADLNTVNLKNVVANNIIYGSAHYPVLPTIQNSVYKITKNGSIIGKNLKIYDDDLSDMDLTNVSFVGVSSYNIQYNSNTKLPADYKIVEKTIVGPGVILSKQFKNYSLQGLNLSNAVIHGLDFSGFDITNTNLTGCQLKNCHGSSIITIPYSLPENYVIRDGFLIGPGVEISRYWSGSVPNNILKNANLTDANLSGLNLSDCDLSNTILTNADLTLIKSGNTIFNDNTILPSEYKIINGYIVGPNVNLTNAVFSRTDGFYYDLSSVDLSRVLSKNISGNVRLKNGFDLWNGIIVGPNINIKSIDISGVTEINPLLDLTGSSINGIIFGSSIPTLPSQYKFVGTSIVGPNMYVNNISNLNVPATVDFHGLNSSNIQNLTFENIEYRIEEGIILGPYVNLSYKQFKNKNVFKNRNLTGVNLSYMDLSNFNLSGTNLSNSVLVRIKSGNVVSDAQTVLPVGYKIVNGYIIGPNVSLANANLRLFTNCFMNTNLSKCDLSNMDLSGFDLTNTILTEVIFTGVKSGNITNFSNSQFSQYTGIVNGYIISSEVNLKDAIFNDTDNLSNYNLLSVVSSNVSGHPIMPEGYKITKGYIMGAGIDLIDINLTYGDLSNINLDYLTTHNIKYSIDNKPLLSSGYIITGEQYIGNLLGPNMKFQNIDLTLYNLAGLLGKNISYENVTLPTGTEFVARYLVGPNMNITDIDLRDSDVSTLNLSGIISDGVKTNSNTVLPTGFKCIKQKIIGKNMNLSTFDFTDQDISNVDLSNSNLSNAIFKNTKSGNITENNTLLPSSYKIKNGYIIGPDVNLQDAYFMNGSDLSDVNFTNVKTALSAKILSIQDYTLKLSASYKLIGRYIIGPDINLKYMDLSDLDLSSSKLTRIKSSNTLSNVNSKLPSLYKFVNNFILGPDVDLSYCDISNIDLTGIKLSNSSTDLSGVVITSNANLQMVKSKNIVNYTNLVLPTGYYIRNGYLVGKNVDLSEADLRGADLRNIDISECNLDKCLFGKNNNNEPTLFEGTIFPSDFIIIDSYVIPLNGKSKMSSVYLKNISLAGLNIDLTKFENVTVDATVFFKDNKNWMTTNEDISKLIINELLTSDETDSNQTISNMINNAVTSDKINFARKKYISQNMITSVKKFKKSNLGFTSSDFTSTNFIAFTNLNTIRIERTAVNTAFYTEYSDKESIRHLINNTDIIIDITRNGTKYTFTDNTTTQEFQQGTIITLYNVKWYFGTVDPSIVIFDILYKEDTIQIEGSDKTLRGTTSEYVIKVNDTIIDEPLNITLVDSTGQIYEVQIPQNNTTTTVTVQTPQNTNGFMYSLAQDNLITMSISGVTGGNVQNIYDTTRTVQTLLTDPNYINLTLSSPSTNIVENDNIVYNISSSTTSTNNLIILLSNGLQLILNANTTTCSNTIKATQEMNNIPTTIVQVSNGTAIDVIEFSGSVIIPVIPLNHMVFQLITNSQSPIALGSPIDYCVVTNKTSQNNINIVLSNQMVLTIPDQSFESNKITLTSTMEMSNVKIYMASHNGEHLGDTIEFDTNNNGITVIVNGPSKTLVLSKTHDSDTISSGKPFKFSVAFDNSIEKASSTIFINYHLVVNNVSQEQKTMIIDTNSGIAYTDEIKPVFGTIKFVFDSASGGGFNSVLCDKNYLELNVVKKLIYLLRATTENIRVNDKVIFRVGIDEINVNAMYVHYKINDVEQPFLTIGSAKTYIDIEINGNIIQNYTISNVTISGGDYFDYELNNSSLTTIVNQPKIIHITRLSNEVIFAKESIRFKLSVDNPIMSSKLLINYDINNLSNNQAEINIGETETLITYIPLLPEIYKLSMGIVSGSSNLFYSFETSTFTTTVNSKPLSLTSLSETAVILGSNVVYRFNFGSNLQNTSTITYKLNSVSQTVNVLQNTSTVDIVKVTNTLDPITISDINVSGGDSYYVLDKQSITTNVYITATLSQDNTIAYTTQSASFKLTFSHSPINDITVIYKLHNVVKTILVASNVTQIDIPIDTQQVGTIILSNIQLPDNYKLSTISPISLTKTIVAKPLISTNIVPVNNYNISVNTVIVSELILTERGICWSTNPQPEKTQTNFLTSMLNTFTITVSNLTAGSYYLRSYCIYNNNIVYGDDKQFTITDSILKSKINGTTITKLTTFEDGKTFLESTYATNVVINEYVDNAKNNTSEIPLITIDDNQAIKETKLLDTQKIRKFILTAKFKNDENAPYVIVPRENLGFTSSQIKTPNIRAINPLNNDAVNLTTSHIMNNAIYCATSNVAKTFIIDNLYSITFVSASQTQINVKIGKDGGILNSQDLTIGKTIVFNGMIITVGSGMISILSTVVTVNNKSISVSTEVINPGNETVTESGVCWSASVSEPTKNDSNNQLTTDPVSNGTYTIVVNDLNDGTYNLRSYYTINSTTYYGTKQTFTITNTNNSGSAGGDPYITALETQEFYKLPGKIRNYRLFQSSNCVINASVSPIKTRDAENIRRAFKDVRGFIPKTDGFYFDAYHIQIGDEFITFDDRIELINKSDKLELLHVKKHEELITNNVNGMSSTYFLTEVLIVDSSCNNILVELKRDINPQIINGISIKIGDVNSIKNTTGALVRRSNPRNYEIKSLNSLKFVNETKYVTSKNYHVKKETFYSKQVVGLRMN